MEKAVSEVLNGDCCIGEKPRRIQGPMSTVTVITTYTVRCHIELRETVRMQIFRVERGDRL